MRKILFILPLLLFMACGSDNEPLGGGGDGGEDTWLVDKLLTNGTAANVTTRWTTNDPFNTRYLFNSKYVEVFFTNENGNTRSDIRKWYVERENHLFVQDRDEGRNSPYREYFVAPINADSTHLSLKGVGDDEGRDIEIYLWVSQ